MHDPTTRKLLSALAHAAIFFNGFLISVAVPIAILALSEDPVVKRNAVESLNFHLNVFAWYLLCLPLVLLCVGLFLLPMVWAISAIAPVVAIVGVLSNPDEPFEYPFIARVF